MPRFRCQPPKGWPRRGRRADSEIRFVVNSVRVLHVIPSVARRDGGPSVAVAGMCRALLAQGVGATVVTTDADGPGCLPVALEIVQTWEGVPTIFFRRRATESFKWSPALAAWLHAHVREVDLVHIHAVFSHASIAAGRACRAAGVPYIVRPLGTLDPWSLARHATRKTVLLALGARRLLARAAAIHYTSVEEQRLAEARLTWLPRGVVVPLGVDDELFAVERVDNPTRPPTILSLSRLDAKKGLELLIAAFHDLVNERIDQPCRLVVAGDGAPEYVARLRACAAAGPARDQIDFSGWVEGARRRELLGRADLFVLPSYQENFGIAAIEAMACGVAALVSPGVNLAGEIVTAEAGWVAERTQDAWRAALGAALSDDRERARRGMQARAFASQFRWADIARRLQGLYDEVRRADRLAATPHPQAVTG